MTKKVVKTKKPAKVTKTEEVLEVVVPKEVKEEKKGINLFPTVEMLHKVCAVLLKDIEDEYYEVEDENGPEYCITNAHVGSHLYAAQFDPYVAPLAHFLSNEDVYYIYVNVTVKKSFVNPDAILMPNPMKVPHSVFLCFLPVLFERNKGQTSNSFSTLRRLLIDKGIILVEGEDIQEIREKIEDRVSALQGE